MLEGPQQPGPHDSVPLSWKTFAARERRLSTAQYVPSCPRHAQCAAHHSCWRDKRLLICAPYFATLQTSAVSSQLHSGV